RVAPIVFMGGSLIPHGGQNPIEPAKFGAAILHGPHVSNFADIYAALDRAKGAELVPNAERLPVRVGAWLKDVEERARVAAAAKSTVDVLGGALERTLTALEPYLMHLRLQHADAWPGVLVARAGPRGQPAGAARRALRRRGGASHAAARIPRAREGRLHRQPDGRRGRQDTDRDRGGAAVARCRR